ncbi:hypothetical protein C8R46DRAFT_1121451 [Mycena filopes]|nr:hypothetical protein C8R46DRAFT_1121205 [Mycena filopes]KAJ7152521.1 hypothetical protein C8R46DRAFT_1121451 [Mycena filopes]
MNAVLFPSGPRYSCVVCGSSGSPVLRQCSGCRFTKYCSRECQRSDWQLHRQFCVSRESRQTLSDHGAEDMPRTFLRWTETWRVSVMKWAVFSADLGNRPPDYLAKNSFLLVLTEAPGLRRPVKMMYKPVRAEMQPDQAIIDYIDHSIGGTLGETITKDFEAILRRNDVVRMLIVAGPYVTTAADTMDKLFYDVPRTRFTNGWVESARVKSRELQCAFLDRFEAAVEFGHVNECDRVLGAFPAV